MKIIKLLLLSVAILSVAFTGLYAIFQTRPDQAINQPIQQGVSQVIPVQTLPSGQRNLLIIGADDLKSARPHLESVWLILYVPPDPHLTLMPIYPSSSVQNIDLDVALEKTFRLETAKGDLDAAFLDTLKGQNLWWSKYVVLDQFAWEKIAVSLNSDASPSKNSADVASSGALQADQNTQSTILKQATVYQELCWHITDLERVEQLLKNKNFNSQMKGHIFSNLNKDQGFAELQMLHIPTNTLSCEFPTLSVQTKASW